MKSVFLSAFGAALLLTAPAAHADVQPPSMVSLTVLEPTTINVVDAPASPTVRLGISENHSGLGQCFVGWVSPNGMQRLYVYDTSEAPKTSGTFDLRVPLFTPYHQAGNWNIYAVRLCDRAGNCREYRGAEIDAFTSSRSVTVVNNRTPDTGQPWATNGDILTSTVSLASNSFVRTSLQLNDANAGAHIASVCLRSPSNTQDICTYGRYSYPAKGRTEYQEGAFHSGAGWPTWETGTWQIVRVEVTDVVGNLRRYTTPAELDALFPGGRTMLVQP